MICVGKVLQVLGLREKEEFSVYFTDENVLF